MNKLDEIAIILATTNSECIRKNVSPEQAVVFAHALLAELSKDVEPVAYLYQGVNGNDWHNNRVIARTTQECGRNQYPNSWKEIGPLFTRPIPANTAEIEQQVAEACISACKDSYSNGDMMLDAIYDLDQGKWREYL